MTDNEYIQTLYKKGIDAYRRGELQKASELLVQVVETTEEDHRAWNALGVVFTKMKRYEDADVCFENALVLDSSNEVYIRNRERNKGHIKKNLKEHLLSIQIPRLSEIRESYPIIGIIGIIALIIILALFLPPVLNPPPQSASSGEIPVFAFSEGDIVLIQSPGGPGLDVVKEFEITVNNQSLKTPGPDPRTLGNYPGATLAIPFDDLYPVSDDNLVTFRVTAIFKDDSYRDVLSKTLSLPVIEEEQVIEEPVFVPYDPLYKTGDVLISKEKGTYLLVTNLFPDNQYRFEELSRRNDGYFLIQPGLARNGSMEEYESLYIKSTELQIPADMKFKQGTLHQAHSIRKSGVEKSPLYVPGDLISKSPGITNEILVILGYDPATDEYATDQIYQYHTGEWGYRLNLKTKWEKRTELENSYPARVNRIALSRIGIGADSSPPGTKPDYQEGDIIARDRSADAKQLLVLFYNPATGEYGTDVIRRSFDGGWDRDGQNLSVLRSALERDYPYKVRNVDVSLVKIK
ncbi:tetratricopeptide repeat protein [Methanospirillum sp.]|uniref:tetratricopeptide repeat protein n=1 Tax=Methanospirillum sp. TaxID=45200 RepID=UPI00359FFA82